MMLENIPLEVAHGELLRAVEESDFSKVHAIFIEYNVYGMSQPCSTCKKTMVLKKWIEYGYAELWGGNEAEAVEGEVHP